MIALWLPLAALAGTLLAGLALKKVLFLGLERWAQGSRSQAPKILTSSLERPFMIWVLILGLYLAMESAAVPPRFIPWLTKLLIVLLFVSLTMMGTRLAGDLIRFYGAGAPGALPVTALTQTLAQLAVVSVGLMAMLNQLGISITPILGALGVGGLAVALALQDTLSNLFAGFYVGVAGQIRVGDYIRLNTGEEGYVTDITWRSTTMRALANNLIVVPNSKLGQAIVTNFHLPEKRLATQVRVNVSITSDPDHVERVLGEEARAAAAELPGLLLEPAPTVRFDPGFLESALGFTVNVHVAEFADQFEVQHHLRKRILTRFREELIEMPVPARDVYLHGEGRGLV
jgi:small-conductance mechanosensitive channel